MPHGNLHEANNVIGRVLPVRIDKQGMGESRFQSRLHSDEGCAALATIFVKRDEPKAVVALREVRASATLESVLPSRTTQTGCQCWRMPRIVRANKGPLL